MANRERLVPPALWRAGQRKLAAPLLPDRARKPAAIVGLGCLVVLAVLAILSAHQSHGHAIDGAVDRWVVGLRVPTHIVSLVSLIGGVVQVTALTAALALACLAARRVGGAVLALAGLVLASALTEFALKPLVHRTIHGYLSYPSGHTTGVFALAAAIAVVLLAPRSGRPHPAVRVAAVVCAVVVGCAVGLAVVDLGYHYFTDTIGGAAAGTGAVIGVTFLLDLKVCRRWLGWPGR